MNTISWNVSPFNLVDIYQYFEKIYCSHLHVRKPPIRRHYEYNLLEYFVLKSRRYLPIFRKYILLPSSR